MWMKREKEEKNKEREKVIRWGGSDSDKFGYPNFLPTYGLGSKTFLHFSFCVYVFTGFQYHFSLFFSF